MKRCRKVANERKLASVIRSLGSTKDSRPECARILLNVPPLPVLVYWSERIVWRERE